MLSKCQRVETPLREKTRSQPDEGGGPQKGSLEGVRLCEIIHVFRTKQPKLNIFRSYDSDETNIFSNLENSE